jgi:F-type H+-transporting ATPase subunit delta
VRDETIARNYAATLFEVADRRDGLERFGEGIGFVGRLLDENPDFRIFLETPKIALLEKKALVRKVFGDTLPPALINFLLVTLDRRRQRLIRAISREYHTLLDLRLNRERVEVTVARPLDDSAVSQLRTKLTALLGREAIPSIRVKPSLLGGVVVRAGDTIYDGSLRRRLDGLRRGLMTAHLHPESGA